MDEPVTVVVAGAGVRERAAEAAAADVAEVLVVEHAALEPYTPDGFVDAIAQVVERTGPDLVLFPHTYRTRDYAPALAARLGRVLIPDCMGSRVRDGARVFVRPMFQGKFVADVLPEGPAPHFASFQIGAYRADACARGAAPVALRSVAVEVGAAAIRQRTEAPFKEFGRAHV